MMWCRAPAADDGDVLLAERLLLRNVVPGQVYEDPVVQEQSRRDQPGDVRGQHSLAAR